MKILVDAREAVRNKSGIGVVARELIKQFNKNEENEIEFIILKPSEKRLFNSKVGRLIEYIWWKSFYTYYQYKKNRCDYIFSLDPIGNLFIKNNISIVHDLIFFVNPSWTNIWGKLWRFLLPKNINNNKLIFTPSINTSNDVCKYINNFNNLIPIKKLNWGYNKNIFNVNYNKKLLSRFNKINFNIPYIFFLGNNEPRRNLSKVVMALGEYISNNKKNINLLIGGDNSQEDREQIYFLADKFNIKENVVFLGYLKDEELAEFYRNALVYIYPSMYEGFGLTIIEAMACGCPVITSNNSSLRYIAENYALLVNPFEQDDITQKLTLILSDEVIRLKYKKLSIKRSKIFNWEITYSEIVKSIKEVR